MILVGALVVGFGFMGYLLLDSLYHRFKWYRLQKKMRELNRHEEG